MLNLTGSAPIQMEELAVAASLPRWYKLVPQSACQSITINCSKLPAIIEMPNRTHDPKRIAIDWLGAKKMTYQKRLFDLTIAIILGLFLLPVFIALAILILLRDGRPILYVSERMKTSEKGFELYKFRTMKQTIEDSGASGGDKFNRITKNGRVLRRTRLDELPQLWNVLKGDISFVGPRPPLREFVEQFPEIYGPVLRSRPGITGLASLKFHAHEERLLANTKTAAETDRIYKHICIPKKATLDLIYQKNQSLCLDIYLMIKTVF